VGDNPGRLAVSDNGRYLHVGLDGASAIRRVDLEMRAADLLFSIGESVDVQDLVALPGSPASVAVSRRWLGGTPVFGGVVVYDHGVARSNILSSHTGPNAIEPGATGSVLYGFNLEDSEGGFYRMNVDAGGVSLRDMRVGLIPAFSGDILYAGGRIYTTDGRAINPETLTWMGSFVGVPHASPVAANPASQHVFYLVPAGAGWNVLVFRTDFYIQVATLAVTNVAGSPGRMTRCGADRLAFVTSAGQLFLIRTSLLPSADVLVRGAFATNQVMVGDTVDLRLVVSNAGPHAVSGVSLTNRLPPGLHLVSAIASQGAITTNEQQVIVAVGALATNAFATVNLLLTPGGQTMGRLIHAAEAAGASVPDPLRANNRLALEVVVLPRDSDGDGLPDEWERAYDLDPNNPVDAQLDSDCDGLTNLEEYSAGRNPLLFESLRFVSPRRNALGQLEATLHAPMGKEFVVEVSTDFLHWETIGQARISTEEHPRVVHPISPAASSLFLRLRTDTGAARPVLTLVNLPQAPGDPARIRVAAPPGRRYSLQASTNLTQWTPVTNYLGRDCITILTDPATNGNGTRFYRMVVP
jgi:uncharacterized repeat protein (TIGR01451 family)